MAMFKKSIVGASVLALVMSVSTVSVVSLSATAAYAERGGNGNGNGNGRSNRDKVRSESARSGNGNSNGRGHLARELRGLNAAHANQNALENASPDSMPGKLYIYQQAQQENAGLAEAEADAFTEYERLATLSEEEIAAEFPDGGYEDAITNAAIAYEAAKADAADSEADIEASLATLTGGDDLSDAALAELNRLLGL